MSDNRPYREYSLGELQDARAHIDVDQYPERAQQLDEEIHKRHDDPEERESSPVRTREVSQVEGAAWTVIRRILSVPVLCLGALFLMTVSVAWLAFFEKLGVGWFLTSVYGSIAVVLLLIGLAIWGRKYQELVAGIILLGVAVQVGAIGGFIFLMLGDLFEGIVPDDFESPMTRRISLGSVISAAVLLGAGTVLVGREVRKYWVRSREGRAAG